MNSKQPILVDQEIQEYRKSDNKVSAFFPKTVFKSHVFSSNERLMAESSTEFKKVKPELNLRTFQDERAFSVEEIASGEQIHGQNRPKRSLFFSAGKPRVTKWKVQIHQYIFLCFVVAPALRYFQGY